jgi:MFS family permease
VQDETAPHTEPQWRVIIAAAAVVTLVGVSLSIVGPLLAFEMDRWGTPATIAGLTATLSGVGNILTVPFVPRLARAFGVRRLVLVMLITAAALHVAFWLMPSLVIWALLRFVLGGVIGTLFVLSEFWIISGAPPHRRGVIMGGYATALAIGFAAGPALLAITGSSGPLPYVATGLIILTGLIPLAILGRAAPDIGEKSASSVLSFVRMAPAATFASLTVGAIEIGMFSQLAIHGLRLGFPERDSALLISAFALGNVLLQLPIGWLADRMDKRRLLLIIAIVASILALALLLLGSHFFGNVLVLGLIGGLVGALYTVGLAHLGGRFTGIALVSANAAFVMLYSMGQIIGPFVMGAAIDGAGKAGVPVVTAIILAAYAGLVAQRMLQQQKAG